MPITIQQIINKIKANDPHADLDLIRRAYEFADKAHQNQTRRLGESYIQHSLSTALTLAEIKADPETIAAGLLHDVPEDTEYTLHDIEKNFGKNITFLVRGITKLGKIKYRGIERYTESIKKMFIAVAEDIRVILIKFADRLHNLKTLEALPEEKRLRIARETSEIFVPIAGLLGIWYLKSQMEDLCFKYVYPEEYKKLEFKYTIEKKIENKKLIQRTIHAISPKFKKEEIKFFPHGRFKSLYSIFQKMQKKDRKFSEIYDVFALRIIVDKIADCYKVIGIIHSVWKPKPHRFKDYIAVPKPNGYRALHTTVFGIDGKVTEFQVLTQKMYDESMFGISAHWHYKNINPKLARLPARAGLRREKTLAEKQPQWIKDVLDLMRQAKNSQEFLQEAKFNVFKNRIFVFTPKGDVIDLPEGATPIDFAYAVHTDIGNTCTGVLINEKMGNLETELKSGDLVEIITEKNRKIPGKNWLKLAKTSQARNKIKHFLKKSEMGGLRKYIKWK